MRWLVIAWRKAEFKGLAEVYGYDTREEAEREAREASSREDTGIVGLYSSDSSETFLDGRNSEENYLRIMELISK